jgi:hypothetical protein
MQDGTPPDGQGPLAGGRYSSGLNPSHINEPLTLGLKYPPKRGAPQQWLQTEARGRDWRPRS